MNLGLYIFALIFSVVIHEFFHGLIATKCGDETPKEAGRLTLNPLSHLDPFGSILMPIFAFVTNIPVPGWAKPVPINPYNFNNPKMDMIKVALAGPLSNIILATISASILRLHIVPASSYLEHLLFCFVLANFILALFNLIPIPPLDGSRIIAYLLPFNSFFVILERFGFILLLLLVCSGSLNFIIKLAFFFSYIWIGDRFFHFHL